MKTPKTFKLQIISGNDRGVALLITLSIITILIVATLELNRKMRSTIMSTAATRDRFLLSEMASSGIHAATAILVKDKMESNHDSIQEDWADPEKTSEVLQDIPFEEGKVTVKISDELGKIQANALVKFPKGREFNDRQRIIWDKFLRLIITLDETLEGIEPTTIINSVKDWLDSGDGDLITGLNGAESGYYQDLDPPYSCRNGPLPHIEELWLIRGITPELFSGFGQIAGISDYMTAYGVSPNKSNAFTYNGKININTAELPVLTALLPSGNEGLAQVIYDYRRETSDSKYINDISSPKWYKNVPGLSDIEIDPELITVASDLFRIESVATLHEMDMTVTAIVKRQRNKKTGKWTCKILYWEAE